jgi:hypothetical protein
VKRPPSVADYYAKWGVNELCHRNSSVFDYMRAALSFSLSLANESVSNPIFENKSGVAAL